MADAPLAKNKRTDKKKMSALFNKEQTPSSKCGNEIKTSTDSRRTNDFYFQRLQQLTE